ncbi:DGK-isoform, putative [Babesia ovis]|uniref:DGK-isoform, putative n=1 Tax=Babesia ovis TaxID=5869 RepID=A0A9W5TBW7_BABOV|nr:DGK-isoform, putative [Babesia ovis]
MGSSEDLVEVCSVPTVEELPGKRCCALVYNGGDVEAVHYAMCLLGVLLNCVDSLKGKYGLLICQKRTWEAAVASLDRNLTDAFDGYKKPCNYLCANYMENGDVQASLDIILKHALRTENVTIHVPTFPKGDASNNGPDQSVTASITDTDGNTHCDGDNSEHILGGDNNVHALNDAGNTKHLLYDNTTYKQLQKIMEIDRSREVSLDRLIVRFVDEPPVKSMGQMKPEPFNTFVEPGLEMKWNYIQAANEICLHPKDIGVTIVAGLANMKLYREQIDVSLQDTHEDLNTSKHGLDADSWDITFKGRHPFDDSSINIWDDVMYRRAFLRSYALCITVTLNALDVNLARLCEDEKLPKLFLIDHLPIEECDQHRFIQFLDSRFQYLYKIHQPRPMVNANSYNVE